MITISTAHPAKFPDAVEKACGIYPALPPSLQSLMHRPEHFETLPNDIEAVKQNILSRI
jgi:threonine synthase